MPKVLDEGGFRISVWPNDHPPPHVHVYKSGGECLVEIGVPGERAASLYENRGMSAKDWQAAVVLVQKHQALALERWEGTRADA